MSGVAHETKAERFGLSAGADEAAARALSAMRALLVSHAASPDKPLPPERVLAAELGIGRRSVRQALSILEAEGRIWRRQGKGTFLGPARTTSNVASVAHRTNYVEVMEARVQIEPALAALAALRASAEQVAMLRRLVKQRDERQPVTAEKADAIELWDSAFHRAIAEAAGNRLLLEIFELIDAIRTDPMWRVLRQRSRTAPLLHGYRRDHAAIVAAIEARDAGGASAAMRSHLRTLQKALDDTVHQDLERGA